ncbi:Rhamnogalacturonase A [Colletotrichum sp. SAR 10_70]|nr:Rhamnogalacturonase A [Colletotrichum sp. SAR 10_71]KAI8204006.1 Rhamnogalacturonase A [Colletotrichum sp. SAR 10_70]
MKSALLAAVLSLSGVAAQLTGPVGPTTALSKKTTECNILNYGGVSDNSTDVADAIENAYKSCVLVHAGSRLIVPEGNYLIKRTAILSNGTNWAFQLDGLITLAYGGNWTVDPVDFEFYSPNGKGAIQGQGYLYRNSGNTFRPRLVRLISPINTSVHDLILVDSPKFHIVFDFAVNLEAYHLTIRGANLGSYDGVDVVGTNYWIHDIEHARNISIIQGNNIAFIKTYPGGSGYVTNITFENFRSKASLYGLDINQYWQNTFEPDTGAVALSNLIFKNFSGSVADGAKRPPLYLIANDLTYATNVTVEGFSLWTESGTYVLNKISNIFGNSDNSYGVGDDIKSLTSKQSPTAYTSTHTISTTPTGWAIPPSPTWAAASTGYGTDVPIPVYTPAPLWKPEGDYDKHYWGSF